MWEVAGNIEKLLDEHRVLFWGGEFFFNIFELDRACGKLWHCKYIKDIEFYNLNRSWYICK